MWISYRISSKLLIKKKCIRTRPRSHWRYLGCRVFVYIYATNARHCNPKVFLFTKLQDCFKMFIVYAVERSSTPRKILSAIKNKCHICFDYSLLKNYYRSNPGILIFSIMLNLKLFQVYAKIPVTVCICMNRVMRACRPTWQLIIKFLVRRRADVVVIRFHIAWGAKFCENWANLVKINDFRYTTGFSN